MTVRADRSQLRVWLLVALLTTIGAATASTARGIDGPVSPLRLHWVALTLICALAQLVEVHIEFRQNALTISVAEVALAVGLVTTPVAGVIAAHVVSMAIALAVRRRLNPAKFAFNLANRLLESSTAVLVVLAVLGHSRPTSPRGWLAIMAGVVSASIVSNSCIVAVIALVRRRVELSMWQVVAPVLFAVAGAALGLLAIDVIYIDWRGLWLVVVALAGSFGVYRAFVRTKARFERLGLLYKFTDALAGTTDLEEVSRRTLQLARELLDAEDAELLVPVPDGLVVHRLGADDELLTDVRRPDLRATIQRRLLDHDAPILLQRGGSHPMQQLATEHGWRDLLAAPLTADGRVGGVLLVANRRAEVDSFHREDLRLLTTFARNTSIALKVGELVEELRREAVEREFRAEHDQLTGLGNRSLLNHKLDAMLANATMERPLALFVMDLDGFKDVNDALGHHTGDMLLVEVARRLQNVVGRRAVVARLGGDEFAIVLPDANRERALAVGHEVQEAVERQVELDRLMLEVRASTGIAFAPHDAEDARTLFQRADIAMYQAKGRRTGVELYDDRFDTTGTRRLTIASELRHALEDGGMRVYYQPQADMRTGQVTGMEALARWPHPTFGSVPPDEFIPIAEHSGLIHMLTRWALDSALAQLSVWRRRWPDLGVSVNMSARNLLDATLVDDVEAALLKADVPAGALTLELTESSVMADPQRSLGVLARLHGLGIRLAIDDFGTGYSSLAYLKRLPVDELKVDKSFVLNMSNDSDDTTIVRSTIDLAHNLGLSTVAEGVENAETWELMVELGCDTVQGYHLARPMPAEEMAAWLAARHPPSVELPEADGPPADVASFVETTA